MMATTQPLGRVSSIKFKRAVVHVLADYQVLIPCKFRDIMRIAGGGQLLSSRELELRSRGS